jgi:hypothetical protein
VFLKIVIGGERPVAQLAPNPAKMLRPVFRERTLVGHHFVTELAGRVAQVNLVVAVTAQSRAVRLLAQAANKPPVIFDYVSRRRLFPRCPR